MASPLALAMMMPGANPPGQLQPTNTTAAYALSQDAAEKNYQAQLAQKNAMWGGLAGLGSAGIMAAPKLYGALTAPAAAAPAAVSGFAPAAGGMLGPADAAAMAGQDAMAGLGAAGATDAFAAGAPVAADLAATAAPAVADAGAMSIADLLPLLATLFV